MVKKIIKICFEVLFLSLCLLIVLHSTHTFIEATSRLLEGLDLTNVQTFFEKFDSASYIKFYIESIQNYITDIINYLFFSDIPFYQIVLDFLELVWNYILDLIIYFCNFGLTFVLILWIILHETFTKEEEDVNYEWPTEGETAAPRMSQRGKRYSERKKTDMVWYSPRGETRCK